MTLIPHDKQYYAVIDLPNAFFLVPVVEKTQLLLAFTFEGNQYHKAILIHLQCTQVSRKKMQYFQETVQYLGFTLKQGTHTLSDQHIQAILRLPHPYTKKDMLSFPGMVNYCRQWIPDCSYYENILRQCSKVEAPDLIQWNPELINAYKTLKGFSLVSAPSLGLPDYKNVSMCMLKTIVKPWRLW